VELQLASLLSLANDSPEFARELHDTARRQAPKQFDDILGQTLAGPLFATWTPTAPVNPVPGAASSGSSTTAPLDPNARRDGRKRSRR
jgi:hypothetical protein